MPCGVPTRDSGLVNIGGVILVAVGMVPDDLEVDGGWYSVFLLVVSSSSSGFNNSEISTLAEGMVADGLVTIICALLHGFNPRELLPGEKRKKEHSRIVLSVEISTTNDHSCRHLCTRQGNTANMISLVWFYTSLPFFLFFLRPRSLVEKR